MEKAVVLHQRGSICLCDNNAIDEHFVTYIMPFCKIYCFKHVFGKYKEAIYIIKH